ncbi:acetylcholinesterase-1 [Nephila pilipes]|uniref:acetylcholinesterase n=1 Tax=Nephila pilipes TaxID=299642 RepID=A0A8X6MUI9_NEPPI|nr:acetylcholinesterase-1 [Nephila pilipes]
MIQFVKRFIGIILPFYLIVIYVNADRVIMTNNGPVQGITVTSGEVEIEAFLGIPYAEPPLGRLRFQQPVPKTSWSGVYDASKLPPPCVQNITEFRYWDPDIENMTEDCLYLNLWVPYTRKSNKLKPIVIYIHGGSFNSGSASQEVYNGKNLAEFGDIIVGSMNYRVGVMGFFSAFIEEANGNMGGYDQLLAIQWMRDNGKYFGGDPNHIVLMAHSAGAMSVSAHLVSPLTKHMIKRAIIQSGAGTIPFILDENAKVYSDSNTLAKIVGCVDRNSSLKNHPEHVVECLKSLPAEILSSAEGLLKKINPITFIPRVGDKFLPTTVVDSLKAGISKDVELLIGIAKDEGPAFLVTSVPQYFGKYGLHGLNSISKIFARQVTATIFNVLKQKKVKDIADLYIGSIQNGTSDKFRDAMALSLGDYFVTCCVLYQAEFCSLKRSSVYFYVFSRRPSSTLLPQWMGITHYDEVQYVFGNPLFKNFTPEEERLSRRLMARWVAFAKTG